MGRERERERELKSVEIRKRKRGERGGMCNRKKKEERREKRQKDVYRLLQSPSKSTHM